MPEKVISNTEASSVKQRRKLGLFRSFTATSGAEEQALDEHSQLARDFAFKFYIRQGGRVEDWGESQEESVRDELRRRWKESEWGQIWTNRHERRGRSNAQRAGASRWVGGSFEVGDVLGVNILAEPAPSIFSAHSELFPATDAYASTTSKHSLQVPFTTEGDASQPSSATTHGSTSALLRPPLGPSQESSQSKAGTEILHRPILKIKPSFGVKSDTDVHNSPKGKGKAKAVHYAESFTSDASSLNGPAPPSEVLGRQGSDVIGTSAGATEPTTPDGDVNWGEVVMRDRMLVRINYTKLESLGPIFDESRHRTNSQLEFEDWAEFMVVWRKHRLELYEDHSFPGKDWLTGHKHLGHIVPLMSSKTRLSLYSFLDMTFAITCPPTTIKHVNGPKSRLRLRRDKEGTNIFIFKIKTRSRAIDWIWRLWRQMGNPIPPTIEIHNPGLDSRVKIDIPFFNENHPELLSRENIIALCMKSLKSTPSWRTIIERQIEGGKTLQLAWRLGTHLDWIWLEDDIHGEPRPWTVLAGLAMKQSIGSAQLEIRLGDHTPNFVRLRDGTRIFEPPSIEGYLDRIKPNTQAKVPVYLVTHNGNVFSLSPSHAHPPSPPGLEDGHLSPAELRQKEVQRGGMQIMDALGVSDLRSILVVRQAFAVVAPQVHDVTECDDDEWVQLYTQRELVNEQDGIDHGGDEGLSKAENMAHVKLRRSFELLLKNGHVVRFEAHSHRVAVEWINRLRELVLYWKHRHRADAREEMELGESVRPLITPKLHTHCENFISPPAPPIDLRAPIPALSSLYNWCALEGCKPIIRGGNVFMRRGLRGQYKAVQMFLVAGNLFLFAISPNTTVRAAKRKKINLTDAYVCSGYFAGLVLPSGQFDPNERPAPRRYGDGLEVDDSDEDTLFAVWFRPQAPSIEDKAEGNAPVPSLSAKSKIALFRTRSKLERDAWCWALNVEIEKLARVQRDREERLRQTGRLVALF